MTKHCVGTEAGLLRGPGERSGFCPATDIRLIPLRPPPPNKEAPKSLSKTPDSSRQLAGQRGRAHASP